MRPALALLLLCIGTPMSAAADPPADPAPASEAMRERLTEREDENRLEEPFTLPLFGRALSLSGQYEILLEGTDPIRPGNPPDGDHRLLLEQEIEAEAFYPLGFDAFLFVQGRLLWDEDLLAETRGDVSDLYVERGETWLALEQLLGGSLGFEIGRLDFEDDRTWWWDGELDALRLSLESGTSGLEAALAWELFPVRSDASRIDAVQEARLRVLVELSHELAEQHGFELFFLFDDDRSSHGAVGESVRETREDESDATLFWLGPRWIGGFDLGATGLLGYWLDAAVVSGHETAVAYADPQQGRSPIEAVRRRRVLGWGFDLGFTWFLPGTAGPRLTLGYALGSGDGSPDAGTDTAFRQTGIQGNETGFGGVRRFTHYGRLLDPELSNLGILTVGAGLDLFASSSLQLVYHHYRLLERADALRDARLETRLDGRHRDLGQSLDLVLAIEEGPRFELELSASGFRSGEAFGRDRGEWAWGALAALRVAF